MKKIELKIIARDADIGCMSGSCPTVYQDETGRFFVQGYQVAKPVENAAKLPQGEGLVEVPEALLRSIAAKLKSKSK